MTGRGATSAAFPAISPVVYRPHPLHTGDRAWPETNCYVDLWIEALSSAGLIPEAMLGFTLAQDFEGDQFTFFKVPLDDLEALYGITCSELILYDTTENHIATQLERGRLCLVEVDGYHLPDTAGLTYQLDHGKTTIGVNRLDADARSLEYFHNGGYYSLSGDDYESLFQHQVEPALRWIPYTEIAHFPTTTTSPDHQRGVAAGLLARHLSRRPSENPLATFAAVFPGQVERVAERGIDFFHLYAFNTVRQFGANFELLASHLDWLDADRFAAEAAAARTISDTAKTTQFMLARAVARQRFEPLASALNPAVDAWDTLFAGLDAKVG
jgi:hypothetical protein